MMFRGPHMLLWSWKQIQSVSQRGKCAASPHLSACTSRACNVGAALASEPLNPPHSTSRGSLSVGWGYWEWEKAHPFLHSTSAAAPLLWTLCNASSLGRLCGTGWWDEQLNAATLPRAQLPGLGGSFASARLDPSNGKGLHGGKEQINVLLFPMLYLNTCISWKFKN